MKMSSYRLHAAQVTILYTLRRSPIARFTDLLRPSGLESDVFKFHLRKLVAQGYVQKSKAGYVLTPDGKEYANNLDTAGRNIQKQPKLSVMIIVYNPDDPKKFLVQQRKRHPYYDFWGCLSGPIRWAESPEAVAIKELQKQTGLTAYFAVHGFYRQYDYNSGGDLLEDKLFTIVHAKNVRGTLANTWKGGFNTWMTLAELHQQEKYFTDTQKIVALPPGGYMAGKLFYDTQQY